MTAPGALSVLFPVSPATPEQVLDFARLVRDRGARRLWLGQSLAIEPHQALAYAAGAGVRVSAGTGVTLAPLRHPYEAALQARSVAALTGQPYVAGYGAGAPVFQSALLGAPYASPRTAMREYLSVVRALLAGERVRVGGEYHRLHAGLVDLPHPEVEVGAGVLRPAMARTAGSVADVAITWMTPPGYVEKTLRPALEEGAESAGRDSTARVVTVVHVAVAREDRDPGRLALLAASAHLGADHYTDMLRRAGVPADTADPVAGARLLVEHDVFVTGTPQRIAEALTEYHRAGVDEIVLNTAGVLFAEGQAAALADLEAVLTAWRPHGRTGT
ncbi:LLM class flavin-dependent oxidoreductase [Streptomyces sp. NBC_00847]|uniref:LLM class flavin-dependent oxidoreductase n=1 Tax=Streptomyces sp. NBC_00847 TaxID=2975850 RepID=UPI002258EACF|nr:LLM class flavin-dependent oxidoreductase [Streptomyces sp. NBC_00847]MCX4882361.1 LLM class flavin-dependent oxidoreductase [Streptomyces sp. NBC_00847]